MKGDPKKLRLFADRVVVEVLSAQETLTASGIILPSTTRDKDPAVLGTVVKVSRQVEENAVKFPDEKLEPGDVVVFSSYSGSELMFDSKSYKVLRITDIYSALE